MSRLHRGSKRSNGSGPNHPSSAVSTLSRLGSLRTRSFGKAVRIATGSGLQTATAVAHPSATLTKSLEGDGSKSDGDILKGDSESLQSPTAHAPVRRWLPPSRQTQVKQKGQKARSKLCSLF